MYCIYEVGQRLFSRGVFSLWSSWRSCGGIYTCRYSMSCQLSRQKDLSVTPLRTTAASVIRCGILIRRCFHVQLMYNTYPTAFPLNSVPHMARKAVNLRPAHFTYLTAAWTALLSESWASHSAKKQPITAWHWWHFCLLSGFVSRTAHAPRNQAVMPCAIIMSFLSSTVPQHRNGRTPGDKILPRPRNGSFLTEQRIPGW